MLEGYKRRLLLQGDTIGDVVKKQSDMIMDETFERDLACKKCLINGEVYLAKFQGHTSHNLSKNSIEYQLQFKTGVHVNVGSYVEIPDDTGTYQLWLIVARNDDLQFVKYTILKCNWKLKWVHNNKIYECDAVISESTNPHISTEGFISTPDGKIIIWLPTNTVTQTIGYNQRFMITESTIRPLCYKVDGIRDAFPVGLTKISLKQDQYNPSTDNIELFIADYYSSSTTPTVPPENQLKNCEIKCNGANNTLVIGGSFRTLTALFYDEDGNELTDFNVSLEWNFTFPDEKDELFVIEEVTNNNQIKIKALRDYSIIGSFVIVQVKEKETDNHLANLELEVVAI